MQTLMRFKDFLRDWGTLAVVITFLVTQWLKIERHENLINAYETHGTPSVVKLSATYDERFKNQAEQMKEMRDIATSNSGGIQEMRSELRAAIEKLGAIKESLEDHKRTTEERLRK